jgi:single-strand DNA-binding protein
MAGSVNKVILVGNLGKDPEVRNAQDGSRIVSFSMATSETWNDRASGERKERTEWHRVVIFNERLGEVAEKYLRKGAKVYVEGAIQSRKWTDPSGVEKTMTEIVLTRFRGELTMLDSRASSESGGGMGGGGYESAGMGGARTPVAAAPARAAATGASWDTAPKAGGDLDDDIPF